MMYTDKLSISIDSVSASRVEVSMPITPDLYQPFGFLHGGATISLLETAASMGAEQLADLDKQLPFGVEVRVRHLKSGKSGLLRGVAELDHEEPSHTNGMKQFWNVAAYDDVGDVVSKGVIVTKIVDLDYLEQKEAARRAEREGQAEA